MSDELLPCPFCGHHACEPVQVQGERWGSYDWVIHCSSSHCGISARIVADDWSEQIDGALNPHIPADQLYTDRLVQVRRMWNRRAHLAQPEAMTPMEHLPDCMMPDGADLCKGYTELQAVVVALRKERDKLEKCAKVIAKHQPEVPRQYSPEELHDVAINTFVPKDFYKNAALGDLIRALERPDGWKPEVIMAGGIVVPPIGGNNEATASTTVAQPEAAEPFGDADVLISAAHLLQRVMDCDWEESIEPQLGSAWVNAARDVILWIEEKPAAPVAAQRAEGAVLDEPAQIGGTIFSKGIKHSTVIDRAKREYVYMQQPEVEAERMQKAKAFMESLRPAPASGLADLIEALESAVAAVWDGHYSGKGVTAGYAQSIDAKAKTAITKVRGQP